MILISISNYTEKFYMALHMPIFTDPIYELDPPHSDDDETLITASLDGSCWLLWKALGGTTTAFWHMLRSTTMWIATKDTMEGAFLEKYAPTLAAKYAKEA